MTVWAALPEKLIRGLSGLPKNTSEQSLNVLSFIDIFFGAE